MKLGRNDPCHCGSGKKFKNCCQGKSEPTAVSPKDSGKVGVLTAAERNHLVALFNAGNHEELEIQTRLLLDRCPGSGFVWKVLGATLQMQGKDSLQALQKAAELLPGDAEAHYNLGNTLRELGQLKEAEASYRRALKIKPDFVMAHGNLGVTLFELGRLEEAEACYRRALKIKPDFVMAYYNLGNTQKARGQIDKAETSYRQALAIDQNYAEAHRKLGVTLYEMGRLAEAEASFRRALHIQPDFVSAHNCLGVALQALNRSDEAEASLRRALQIDPGFADAYGNLGDLLREQGKVDEALACYRQQVTLSPDNGMAQHHIASLTGINTERATAQYVEKVFDDYADKFDTHLQQVLKYDAPAKIVALVRQYSTIPGEKWNVLDLGCGTGLVGAEIAPFSRQLVGVDLSAKMLEKARARNIYQRLERLDLLTMMQAEAAASYDVIIAADVFVYLGRLEELISEINRLLRPGGIFAFSVEDLEVSSKQESGQDAQQDYQLGKTGRYSHSANYIRRLASAGSFLPQVMEAAQIRMEHDKQIMGHLVLWKK